VDIAPTGDLIVAFRKDTEASILIEDGKIELTIRRGVTCVIPTAPVIEQGVINCRRYLVKARSQPGISHLQVVQLLQAEGYRVVHTELEAHASQASRTAISTNGLVAYLDFRTADEALNMRDTYRLDSHEVRIWHKGRLQCSSCNERGHKADRHQEIENQQSRTRLKKKAFKQRKRADEPDPAIEFDFFVNLLHNKRRQKPNLVQRRLSEMWEGRARWTYTNIDE
jgi:hypothetical protein